MPDAQEPAKPNQPADRPWALGSSGGMPGFDKAPQGTPSLYWQMRKYSMCRLGYALITGPIFAGTQTLEICRPDDGKPANARNGPPAASDVVVSPEDKAKTAYQNHFRDLWTEILNGLRCLEFGYWLQEIVWDRVNGLTVPVRFKSFLPWQATLLRDPYGDFAGYRVPESKDNNQDRAPAYAWHAVHEDDLDPLFGVPRLEYARELWWRARQSEENGDRLERKASGISLLIRAMTGESFSDDRGQAVLQKDAAQTIFNALSSGGAAMVRKSPFQKKDIIAKPELADINTMDADQFDWGDTGQAIIAQISRLDAIDKRILRAMNRPEREALEGTHGTKAEAGVHGQIGVLDSEKVHSDILRQFNRQVFDRVLITNQGAEWKGRLYWKPTPLTDETKAFKQGVAKALAAVPGDPLAQQLDRKKLLEQVELPADPNYVPMPMPTEPPPDPNAADPLAARNNGNGQAAHP